MYVVIRLSANGYEGTVIMAGSAEGSKVQVPSADPTGRDTAVAGWIRYARVSPQGLGRGLVGS